MTEDKGPVAGEAADAAQDGDSDNDESKLQLRYAGWLVQQLGADLYPSVTASVAELISNAWDAEAENVWVTIPFDAWHASDRSITVIDDGLGMTFEQARDQYLVVGFRRREEGSGTDRTENGKRKLHGRKGIGKLAAFGTAERLECVTRRNGQVTAFALDYKRLRTMPPSKAYDVDDPEDASPPTAPDGRELEHGTRVTLRGLNPKRRPSETRFIDSMARRFALTSGEMCVHINKHVLTPFEAPALEFRFPPDAMPSFAKKSESREGWAESEVADDEGNKHPVQWWVGFSKTPLADEEMQGISVLAHGKLANRPFTFDLGSGVTGQLGLEYMVGEVQADWIDEGSDSSRDLVQSNRDSLQWHADELRPFKTWGQNLIKWALKARNDLRTAGSSGGDGELDAAIENALDGLGATDARALRRIAERLLKLNLDVATVAALVAEIRGAQAAAVASARLQRLIGDGDPVDPALWQALSEAGQRAAHEQSELLAARIDVLQQLRAANGELEELPDFESLLLDSPWLLGPPTATVIREGEAAGLPLLRLRPVEGDAVRVVVAPPRPRLDVTRAQDVVAAASAADVDRVVADADGIGANHPLVRSWDVTFDEAITRHRALLDVIAGAGGTES